MNETKVLLVTPGKSEGSWLKIRVVGKDKEGKEIEKDNYVKDPSLFPLIKEPGIYEFTKEKHGEYWEIVGAKFLRPADRPFAAGNENGKTSPSLAPMPKTVEVNVLRQNDSICAQVATKAAAEIVCEALRQGAFISDKKLSFDAVMDNSAVLARVLMAEIGKFVNAEKAPAAITPAPASNDKNYVDDSGLIHERVEGA